MQAYIINLDTAKDRWAFMEKSFAELGLPVTRIPAVNGRELALPHPDYDEAMYRRTHGRTTNPGEIGCYLSHIKAMKAFLESDEKVALICEDDIILKPDLLQVIEAALKVSSGWNVLRLSGLSSGNPWPARKLTGEYEIFICMGRLKGTGAYLIDRKGAEAYVRKLLPMRLPYDHAIDREWFYGLKAAYVQPFPVLQDEGVFRSSIQRTSGKRLSKGVRVLTVYPYQIYNEVSRTVCRTCQWLGWKLRGDRQRLANDEALAR